jgi:methyl-accepting chemotaxis protein
MILTFFVTHGPLHHWTTRDQRPCRRTAAANNPAAGRHKPAIPENGCTNGHYIALFNKTALFSRRNARPPCGWRTSALVFYRNNAFVGRVMDNRRKTIVINKQFQYQYSLLIAALAVLLVNGFILLRMLFPGEQPLALSTQMIVGIAALEFILIAAIWYGSLRASHRIAGPVYVFAREIGRLGEGDLNASIVLRDKDMFQPEAEQMNRSIAALRNRIAALKDLSQQLQKAHSTNADVGPIVEKLAAELSVFALGNNNS